jgi:hypothetical protein
MSTNGILGRPLDCEVDDRRLEAVAMQRLKELTAEVRLGKLHGRFGVEITAVAGRIELVRTHVDRTDK